MASPSNAWNVTLPEGVVRDANFPANTQAINAYGQGAANNEGLKPTYRAAINAYTPYTNAADIVALSNPSAGTTTIRVTHVAVSGRATAASQVDIQLLKRSALNTGGTPTNITKVPMDSNDAAAGAALVSYAASPTPGTLVGSIGCDQTNISATGSGGASVPSLWDFGIRGGRCLVLHPNESLCINLGGVAVPAGTALDIEIEWTEETPPLGTNP